MLTPTGSHVNENEKKSLKSSGFVNNLSVIVIYIFSVMLFYCKHMAFIAEINANWTELKLQNFWKMEKNGLKER